MGLVHWGMCACFEWPCWCEIRGGGDGYFIIIFHRFSLITLQYSINLPPSLSLYFYLLPTSYSIFFASFSIINVYHIISYHIPLKSVCLLSVPAIGQSAGIGVNGSVSACMGLVFWEVFTCAMWPHWSKILAGGSVCVCVFEYDMITLFYFPPLSTLPRHLTSYPRAYIYI